MPVAASSNATQTERKKERNTQPGLDLNTPRLIAPLSYHALSCQTHAGQPPTKKTKSKKVLSEKFNCFIHDIIRLKRRNGLIHQREQSGTARTHARTHTAHTYAHARTHAHIMRSRQRKKCAIQAHLFPVPYFLALFPFLQRRPPKTSSTRSEDATHQTTAHKHVGSNARGN